MSKQPHVILKRKLHEKMIELGWREIESGGRARGYVTPDSGVAGLVDWLNESGWERLDGKVFRRWWKDGCGITILRGSGNRVVAGVFYSVGRDWKDRETDFITSMITGMVQDTLNERLERLVNRPFCDTAGLDPVRDPNEED